MIHEINLDEIRIASPCHASWEDMNGNDRVRFCGQCQKQVYNFSTMRRVEVENLIHEKEGKLCGRFYRRTDGRMLTADCPSESRNQRNRFARLGSAVIAFVLFFANGCARNPTMGAGATKITPLGNPKHDLEITSGVICVPQSNTNPAPPPNDSAK